MTQQHRAFIYVGVVTAAFLVASITDVILTFDFASVRMICYQIAWLVALAAPMCNRRLARLVLGQRKT